MDSLTALLGSTTAYLLGGASGMSLFWLWQRGWRMAVMAQLEAMRVRATDTERALGDGRLLAETRQGELSREVAVLTQQVSQLTGSLEYQHMLADSALVREREVAAALVAAETQVKRLTAEVVETSTRLAGFDQIRQAEVSALRDLLASTHGELGRLMVLAAEAEVGGRVTGALALVGRGLSSLAGRGALLDAHSSLPEGSDVRRLEWTPDMVERFWTLLSRTRLREASFSHQVGHMVAALVKQFLPVDAAVLDFGGGDGAMAAQLIGAGFSCAAYEPSSGRRKLSAASLGGLDGFLGFSDLDDQRSYDAIIMCEVIEHILEPDLPGTLAWLAERLRPGGKLIVTCPNGEDLEQSFVLCPTTGDFFHRWQHVRSLTPASLMDLLEPFGLRRQWMAALDYRSEAEFFEWLDNTLSGRPVPFSSLGGGELDALLGSGQGIFLVAEKRGGSTLLRQTGRVEQELALPESLSVIPLSNGIIAAAGRSFAIPLPHLSHMADDESHPNISPYMLYEDDRPLGPPHSSHDHIGAVGTGSFSHWKTHLYFSTSDNTDPIRNGRRYVLRAAAPSRFSRRDSGPAL